MEVCARPSEILDMPLKTYSASEICPDPRILSDTVKPTSSLSIPVRQDGLNAVALAEQAGSVATVRTLELHPAFGEAGQALKRLPVFF
eukprot:s4462_g3.t1